MPYVFSFLLFLNIGLFGYFVILHKPVNTSAIQAETKLVHKVDFKNSSKDIPPLIGQAD